MPETALRLLIDLTRRAIAHNGTDFTFQASSRELAKSTRSGRPAVRAALRDLGELGLITFREGTATHATTIRVNTFDTVSIGGSLNDPPSAQGWVDEDPTTPPQMVLVDAENTPLADPGTPRAIDIDPNRSIERLFDRMSKAVENANPEDVEDLRGWLQTYHQKSGHANAHPPDDRIVAQLLAIAPHDDVVRMLKQLFSENRRAGDSYAWYVAVALQRIHGITPQRQAQFRARLKLQQAM